jgi:hypothetical protein
MMDPERIARLEEKVERLDSEVLALREEQCKLRDGMHASELESNDMGAKLRNIEAILLEMTRKKLRTADVIILAIGLAIGATSAYAAIQNNQLTKVMIQIEEQTKPR